MSEDKIRTIKTKIEKEIPYIDIKPFSHNIIGLELRMLGELTNDNYVYDYIRQVRLNEMGWYVPDSIET